MVKDMVTTDDGKKEKKEKKKKAIFDIKSAMAVVPVIEDGKATNKTVFDIASKDGRLFAMPKTIYEDGDSNKITYQGWDMKLHKPIPKSSFSDDVTYIEYQAEVAMQQGNKFLAVALLKSEQAATLRKFGDKKLQKKAAKLEKMRKALAALEAELAEESQEVA